MKRHLTLSGLHAGQTLCGGERTGNDWHHAYAKLEDPTMREQVCPACLQVVAESYEADELPAAPEWVRQLLTGDSDKQADLFGGEAQ